MTNKAKRIVIIGGVAGGTKTAAKARREDPNAQITVYTDEEYISYSGCGEPYYIGDEFSDRKKLLSRSPEQFDSDYGIAIKTRHRATRIDPASHQVEIQSLESGETRGVEYDVLVIATGARSIRPPIPGSDLPGVHTLRKLPEAFAIRDRIDSGKVKRAVIAGGGYIGLELVEALVDRGVEVILVEKASQLAPPYDEDVAEHIRKKIEERGVSIRLGQGVDEILGSPNEGVNSVRVGDDHLSADMVILAVGVRPNSELAKEAGIELGASGAIRVNDRMRTNIPDIYAVGDCVESIHRVSGQAIWVPLGSTANRQGRVAGINITGGDARFPGILSTSIFRVFGLNVARTGLIEREARELGYDIVTAVVPVRDKVGYMRNSKTLTIKLIAEKETRRFLGAQVWGAGAVDKAIDIAATALAFNAKVDDLMQLDLAYAPPFSPALSNINTAANVLMNKLEGATVGVSSREVEEKDRKGDDFVFLDVRNAEELANICLDRTCNIPLSQLKGRIAELPEGKEIVTSCASGLRAAMACRVLKSNGCQDVKYLDGGITVWPHPKKGPAIKS